MNRILLNNDFAALLAMTPPPAQPGQEQASILTSIVPMILMIAVFYFVLIRPQMKAKKEQETMITTLKTGDEVVTSGGILGRITHVKEDSVMIKVDESAKLEVLKAHITARTATTKKV